MKNIFYSFIAIAILSGCQTAPKCGPEIRAAFDIGSGSTKVKVVEVNTCAHVLTRVIAEEQAKVDYRDALEKNAQGEFSEAIQQEGIAALEKLKMSARAQGATRFTGIATAAYRQAKNAEVLVKLIREKVGIPVRVISQNEEAMLGFNAVVEKEKLTPGLVLIWDVGGGSQQMTALDENSQPMVYYGQLASVSLKNHVIEKIQKKDLKKVESPNPLKKPQVKKALGFVEAEATSSVPQNLQAKIKAGMKIFGIGGVLTKSVPRQVGKEAELSQGNIQAALEKRAGLTDKDINDPYAATEVTNLILVSGFMKALGIANYTPTEVSLMDGLWLNETIWQKE